MQYRLGRYRGAWCVIWRDPVKGSQRRSLGLEAGQENRAAAEAALAEFTVDMRRAATAPRGLVTIRKILDAYHVAKPDQAPRPALYAYFGNWTVNGIDREACRKYAAQRALEGMKPATIYSELGILRTALRRARDDRWISEIPTIELPGRGVPRERWLTAEEAADLLDAAVAPHIRLFIEIALYTGARKGAILGLTWNRVSFDLARIDFADPGLAVTRKRRPTVPIRPGLLKALRDAYEIRTSDYVVEWAGGRVGNVKHGFAEACVRAGLTNVTPHTLRHTAATWAAQAGAPMREIAGMLGHTTTDITERVYAKHHPDYLSKAASAIEDRLRSARIVTMNPKTGTDGERER